MKPKTTEPKLEELFVRAFTLGTMDALGSRSKPDPLPALKSLERWAQSIILERERQLKVKHAAIQSSLDQEIMMLKAAPHIEKGEK